MQTLERADVNGTVSCHGNWSRLEAEGKTEWNKSQRSLPNFNAHLFFPHSRQADNTVVRNHEDECSEGKNELIPNLSRPTQLINRKNEHEKKKIKLINKRKSRALQQNHGNLSSQFHTSTLFSRMVIAHRFRCHHEEQKLQERMKN